MASSNIRHREGGAPQLQVPRRSSHSRPIGIQRVGSAGPRSGFLPTSTGTRQVSSDNLSASAPDTLPLLHQTMGDHRPKTYGSLHGSQPSPTSGASGEAAASTRRPSASRIRDPTSTPLSTVSSHRLPQTRSFLVAPGSGNAGLNSGSAKGLGTMSPLPKHQRTSKTSQKLVVLPSAPQTKPLSKQLVLLDEEQESSDDAAHPHGFLPPPRRIGATRKPLSIPKPTNGRIKVQEDDDEEGKDIPIAGEESQQPSKMRIRDYKSSAERMSKEERKQAGHKRMTAYCIAEGLKTKVLAGFLKREHNVLPRVFDEALYVMYHLPLLPGYGPQTNVRSSAPPATVFPSSATGTGFSKSILTRLEEAEENGYQGSYFPQTQDLVDLEQNTTESHRISAQGFDGFTTDGEQPDTSMASLPGWVQPAEVDEIREQDGYVTSSSLPRAEDDVSANEYAYEYPTSSSAMSTPTILHKPLPPLEQSDAESGPHNTVPESLSTPPSGTPFVGDFERHYVDSGAETDDPGIQTDPGVYGSPTSPTSRGRKNNRRNSRVQFANRSPMSSIGERDTPDDTGDDRMAPIAKTVPIQSDSKSSESESATAVSEAVVKPKPQEEEISATFVPKPKFLRASTLPIVEGITANTGPVNDLIQDELHVTEDKTGTSSAYELQLAYEREREEREALLELERERQRQLEYEQALERERERERERQLDDVGEVVFFDYGVAVFFGLTEREERDILDDIENAGVMRRPIIEDEWEVEECHFAHDPNISYPRIYNDFFTLKSRSHLLKLSIAHALAQSTLLARYETIAQRTLSSPLTLSIPRQLASSGSLQLRRHEALKLTGRLFKLRRDVNLVSNVLDVPELFWSEASLKDLYDAVREYMEIGPRVENLNEKLGVASDFLDAIHDHLNNNAMERITWIIIWLIVVAVLVELGEIIARLVVHAGIEKEHTAVASALAVCSNAAASSFSSLPSALPMSPLSKEEALRALEKIMRAHT